MKDKSLSLGEGCTGSLEAPSSCNLGAGLSDHSWGLRCAEEGALNRDLQQHSLTEVCARTAWESRDMRPTDCLGIFNVKRDVHAAV